MLRIRLRRVGKKKKPMYRIVVADSRAPRDGAFVESLGYYHPLDDPSTIVLDEERAKHWLDKGAQPSTRVAKILQIQGVAEVSKKVATRIALGEQRKAEAATAKKADAAAEAKAEEPKAEAATEAKAEEPKAEAAAEAKAEEPKAEAAAEEPKAEAATAQAPAEEAPAEEPTAEAEAPTEEAGASTSNDASSSDTEASASAEAAEDTEKSKE